MILCILQESIISHGVGRSPLNPILNKTKRNVMTTYEFWNLSIKGMTLVAVLIGAYLTIRQLKLNAKIYQDDHDWKRRDASNKIIQQINECPDNVRLNDIFQLSTNYTPIELKLIEKKIKEDYTVQNSIHKVLNDYEGIAVGINQGLYDEETELAKKYQESYRENRRSILRKVEGEGPGE